MMPVYMALMRIAWAFGETRPVYDLYAGLEYSTGLRALASAGADYRASPLPALRGAGSPGVSPRAVAKSHIAAALALAPSPGREGPGCLFVIPGHRDTGLWLYWPRGLGSLPFDDCDRPEFYCLVRDTGRLARVHNLRDIFVALRRLGAE